MANEKHIFIGIGGSGCQTVSQIKEKVYEKRFPEATKTKSRLQAMNDSYRFLFLDTDQRDIDEANKRNRATFEQGKTPFISPQTDLINLGRANPSAVYYEAKNDPNNLINKRILEACSPELAAKIPDQPLQFGAGAFRMKSRIAFAHALADFQSKVQAAISGLNDVKTVGGEDCIIYYWVVGSTLGGTGSGIFNDVLYHLNQIHHQVVGNGDPQLVLTMYMPKVYIDSNSTEEKYALNAFGVFSELEAFKAMSFNPNQNTVMHRLAFQNDYNLINSKKRYCPFYYLIPVDIQTDKGTSLGTTKTMYRNTAEMLFHLHNGKAGATFRSDIDNYMNDIMERNHKEFLVPMGYVSLQKPNEQFNKYMRFRLRKDILEKWLLCDTKKDAEVPDSEVERLVNELFRELNPKIEGTIANKIAGGTTIKELYETLESQDDESDKLSSELDFGSIQGMLDDVKCTIENEKTTSDKRDEYKRIIVEGMWNMAEKWVREHGLTYTYNALGKVWTKVNQSFKEEESKSKSNESKNDSNKSTVTKDSLQKLHDEARKIDLKEKTFGSNKEDIEKYTTALNTYVTETINQEISKWAHDIKKDFCTDEKNDEISKLKKHIAMFKDKASEMNRKANETFQKLASDLGMASMDVTTVYLPQLTTICDGNGWKEGNLFESLYATIFKLNDQNPEHKDFTEFLNTNIYDAVNEEIVDKINEGHYKVVIKKVDDKTKEETATQYVRYFCNPNLDRSNEKIIEDFLSLAVQVLETKMRDTKDIRERWNNKKISSFFADLTNEVKDEVRRSLNPALFFSYNSNRIDVMKKEEHIVFVAGSEDLAAEMLGFQKGNPKHRHEKSDDENVALVLKSKYGLSLEDYRIYDSIKMVYDKATFREKYHFHHDFAQFQDKITLSDLPDEILPQHYTYAKMLMLNMFENEMKEFFYVDEYDQQIYTSTMLKDHCETETEIKIARPEAFSINPENGKIVLKTQDNGRELFQAIEGRDMVDRFAKYCDMYYNYRFGETAESILQALLRQRITIDKAEKTGEQIFKLHYADKYRLLLSDLMAKRDAAQNPNDKRLYKTLFNLIRENYGTPHDFIK